MVIVVVNPQGCPGPAGHAAPHERSMVNASASKLRVARQECLQILLIRVLFPKHFGSFQERGPMPHIKHPLGSSAVKDKWPSAMRHEKADIPDALGSAHD